MSHTVSTAYELGWSSLVNGELLQAAELQFDALITTDQSLKYQQNMTNRKIAILVLPFASWPKLQQHRAVLISIVDALKPGDYVELEL